ncbi:DUF4105 domain-containing protein [Bdellovibrio bacteriovorus]|uniref:lipoprotein N-acyltransferase Lnb domain-containing protein n=1 Tax=Bdellovibrio bacteriovorus TaxID=959 RepID=UPI0035A71A18
MKYRSLTVLGLVFFAMISANAASLSADSEVNTTLIREFLSKTEMRLPPQVIKFVGPQTIDFKDMSSLPGNLCSKDVNYKDLVKSSILKFRKRIYLHKGLLPYLKGSKSPCAGDSIQNIAARALIFEISRLYDRSDKHWDNATDKAALSSCEFQHETDRQNGNLFPICQYYLKSSYRVSGSPAYKNLSDFKGNRIQSKNELPVRLGNIHELDSPDEHFAYNFTQFLTDPSYQCRKPSFHTYFQRLTGFVPFAAENCAPVTHLYTSTGAWKIDVDPAKVYEVHFLFASKGEEMMSRWGHSMLRLVVCAPTRKTVGPECLADVAYHVVLSYRANIDDVIVNYWDGLTGKYPSQIMTFSMNEVIDEYTRGQWRDLISLPLKISAAEKKILVESALEHYWSYAGDYKFLSNNCASETDQLMRAALPKNHSYQDTFAASPLGVYRNLKLHQLVDEGLLKDEKDAKRKGYFFPSQKESLDKAFNHMRPFFLGYRDLSEWAEYSKASDRAKVYETLETFEDIGNAYMLEKYAHLVQQGLQGKLIARLLQGDNREAAFVQVIAGINQASQNRLPWKLAQGGYGVPLAAEVVSDEEVALRLQEGIKWGGAYKELVMKKFPGIDRELVGIKQNLELLTNRRRF